MTIFQYRHFDGHLNEEGRNITRSVDFLWILQYQHIQLRAYCGNCQEYLFVCGHVLCAYAKELAKETHATGRGLGENVKRSTKYNQH